MLAEAAPSRLYSSPKLLFLSKTLKQSGKSVCHVEFHSELLGILLFIDPFRKPKGNTTGWHNSSPGFQSLEVNSKFLESTGHLLRQ